MKNKEKYFDEIMDIVTCSRLAVNKETHKPCMCKQIECNDCMMHSEKSCRQGSTEWLESEYEPCVDWSKVKVDTKVLVSEDGKKWYKRHFAKYENGKVYVWYDARTSWTVVSKDDTYPWDFAKLYEEEEDKTVTYYSGDKVYYQGRLHGEIVTATPSEEKILTRYSGLKKRK